MMSAAHSRVLLPIVPEAGVTTGVGSWVNTLVATQRDISVRPLAMNVYHRNYLDTPIAIGWTESHCIEALDRGLDEITGQLPQDARVYLAPGWGELAYRAAARCVARHANARLIAVCHTDDESYYNVLTAYAEHIACMLGVSERTVAELRKRFPGKPVARLHHPVVAPVVRNRIVTETLRVLYAGRVIEQQKRVSRLLDLANGLHAAGLAFTLDIVGDGSAQQELAVGFARGGFTDSTVRFLGVIPPARMPEIFAERDVYVMTSDYEGSPLGLLEAMAAGLVPVVMRVSSGIDEVVVNGVTGYIVASGDVSAMTDRIAQLARHPAQRLAMAARAAARIGDFHDPRRCWQELAAAMRQADHHAPALSTPADLFAGPISGVLEQLASRRAHRVAVYGAGMFGRAAVDAVMNHDTRVVALCDGDTLKQGREYRGITITSPSEIFASRPDAVVIGSLSTAAEMAARIQSFAQGKIPLIVPMQEPLS